MDEERAAVSRRRFGRAVLLGGAATAALGDEHAQAASTSGSWLLGGNGSVKTDGSSYLGTKNAAPLIFKTTAAKGTAPAERMRITPDGTVHVAGVAAVGTTPHAKTALTVDVASKNGIGILGTANHGSGATGVYGSSINGTGVHGSSPTGFAVYGTTNQGVAVRGESYTDGNSVAAISGEGIGQNNIGVLGTANAGTTATGVYGTSNDGTGVHGSSLHAYAVYGSTEDGTGVRGESYTAGDISAIVGAGIGPGNTGVEGSGAIGVQGFGTSSTTYGWGVGVRGDAHGKSSVGVMARGDGVGAVGVYAVGYDPNGTEDIGVGGRFIGDVDATGTISQGSVVIRIDHPLDPSAAYLQHAGVASPDMMNVYNGNVTTDAAGRATVALPPYFMALNRDFRYQLTVLGTFARAIIGREIEDGRFEIHTDKPNVRVSWQVTGIRSDAYAEAHRPAPMVTKLAAEKGTYLHPAAHGQPVAKHVHHDFLRLRARP